MGSTCIQEALAGLFAIFHKSKPMLPAPSCPQNGMKCTIQHRLTRRNSILHKLYDVSADAVGEGAYGTVRKTWSRETGTAYVMKTVAKKDKQKEELANLADEIAIHEMCDHPGSKTMGSSCMQEALAGLFAIFHKPKPMLPAPSCPQNGVKCTIQHRLTRRNSILHKLYDVSADTVGEGAYGTVRKTWSRETGTAYVMKTVAKKDKQKEELANLANEIAIHEMCDHPGIVRIYESFEDIDHVHIAMEACDGGEPFDFVQGQGGRLNEPDARIVMQQVLQAVFYLHSVKNVVHMDLKLENLLLKSPGLAMQDNAVKLIDFGFAKSFTPGERSLTDSCGTPVYMAPEIIRGPYSEKCDLWSCGALLHEVISGQVPFDSSSPMKIVRMAGARPVQLGGSEWDGVSEDAKALVLGMLTRNPDDRLSAEQALETPWLRSVVHESHGTASLSSDSSCKDDIAENLRAFSTLSGFQKAALRVAAYRLDDPHVAEQRSAFKRLDKNGDGRLTLAELDGGCPELGLASLEALELFRQLDTDGSGSIEYSEFLSAAISKDSLPSHACWEAFRVCDKDGSGSISAAEVQELVHCGVPRDTAGMPAKPGKDEEAQALCFDEFVSMLRRSSAGGA